MFDRTKSVAIAAMLSAALPGVLAQDYAIPCTLGQGTDNGCLYCDDTKGIEITPWFQATTDPSFDMPDAAAKNGAGGWDVWWNIPQPGDGCLVILTEPFTTQKGSFDAALSGNVVLSTAHGGCYYAHVGNGGVNAAFCCGSGDCANAGAQIHLSKREAPLNKYDARKKRLALGTSPNLSRRWGGQPGPGNGQPQAPDQPPPPPPVTCNPGPATSDFYTKSGPQQVDGQILMCNGGDDCTITASISIAAGTSLMNEQSTTITDTQGMSLSIMAGFMLMPGPMGSVTGTISSDWSNSVNNAMSTTSSNTVTKSVTHSWTTKPGVNFNAWFTPTLSCQMFTVNCNGVDQPIEKCTPVLNANGEPDGTFGLMAIG